CFVFRPIASAVSAVLDAGAERLRLAEQAPVRRTVPVRRLAAVMRLQYRLHFPALGCPTGRTMRIGIGSRSRVGREQQRYQSCDQARNPHSDSSEVTYYELAEV